MNKNQFKSLFLETINNKDNPFHPLVWINGDPVIQEKTYIGGFSEINAKGAIVTIGNNCDIASFVAINVADSHRQCIGLQQDNACKNITIEDHVFIGSHSAILGGSYVGHHCVISAGSIIRGINIPPFSLVINDVVKEGYYRDEYEKIHGSNA